MFQKGASLLHTVALLVIHLRSAYEVGLLFLFPKQVEQEVDPSGHLGTSPTPPTPPRPTPPELQPGPLVDAGPLCVCQLTTPAARARG